MSPGLSSAIQINHINSETWFFLDNNSYIEEGLYNGWEGNFQGGLQTTAYQQFWADISPGYYGVFYEHTIQNISPDGVNHSYQISRAPTFPNWNIYVDGNYVNVSTVTQSADWKGYNQQVGGELQSNSVSSPPGSFADTFDMSVAGVNSAGQFFTYGSGFPTGTYVDAPGSCFNGQVLNSSEYAWNKHC